MTDERLFKRLKERGLSRYKVTLSNGYILEFIGEEGAIKVDDLIGRVLIELECIKTYIDKIEVVETDED